LQVTIPYKNGDLISIFHEYGKIDRIVHGISEVIISGRIPVRLLADFGRFQTKKSLVDKK